MTVSKELEFKIRHLFESFGVSVENFMLNKVEIKGKQPIIIKDPSVEQKQEQDKKEEKVEGEIMYCPSCGVDLPPLSVYCFKCGVKIQEDK